MYPCFTICCILGIFPYKINAAIFEASRSRYVVFTVISCVTCVYQIIRIYEINMLSKNRNSTAAKIQDNCYSILGSFIVIVSFILSGPRMRLLQKILQVSTKLPQKSFEKLSKLIHIKDIFGFLFLMVQNVALLKSSFYQNVSKNIGMFLITEVMEHYISVQIFQMNMLYVNCVCILKAFFKRIDDNLTNLQELIINDKSHVPRLIYGQQRNPLAELKTFEKQHLLVSNVVQMLNIIFSPQLLATFAIVFIEITFELYINMVQWHNGLSINFTKQIRNILGMSYIMYHIITITLIVWACETGKNQVKKINTTIHDFLNSTSDKQLKNEVQIKKLISLYH
ncbi:uncharacterized protein LOC114254671 [Monomorium pharaonis]|uniref:uncharacterized protein LOC114254671 n=1 Tax=Monomorium pharaonis TaxID=307658 RepID=UPI0017472491|nr:uncharacterized protein LOC114254671 [Monomorium pharaonis]